MKKMASDSQVSTPALMKQIRSYLALTPASRDRSAKKAECSGFKSVVDALSNENGNVQPTEESEQQDQAPEFILASEETKMRRSLPDSERTEFGTKPKMGGMSAFPAAVQPAAYILPAQYYSPPMCIPMMVQPNVASIAYNYVDYTAANTSGEYLTGRIKFFDEGQNYGFFVMDCDGSDLFVHYDDLAKAGITKEMARMAKANGTKFAFRCMKYYGKYDMSYKAVDIQVLENIYSATYVDPTISVQ